MLQFSFDLEAGREAEKVEGVYEALFVVRSPLCCKMLEIYRA
jgi:hypothetical protein